MDGFSVYRCSMVGTPERFSELDEAFLNRSSFSLHLTNFHVEDLIQPSQSECDAYELYIHLRQLSSDWSGRLWLGWANEDILRPALQSLELSFRMISYVLCDLRSYLDKEEWIRSLEDLINLELEIIALISEGDCHAPVVELALSKGVLAIGDAQEVWQRPGGHAVVSRSSQESLLPRLACWSKSHEVVARIRLAIESQMLRAPFTLGLGEPNLCGKPILQYDRICKPLDVYECRRSAQAEAEDHTLSTTHQIFECWLFVAHRMLIRVERLIEETDFRNAAKMCWMVERIWKILSSTMDILLLMDPDDFMKLKHDLAIHTSFTGFGGAFCLRSSMLRTVTNLCKDLRHLVPKVVGVEADPKGGPRLQEALMDLLHTHAAATTSVHQQSNQFATIHLLQSFQAIETATRRFFFSYQQLVISIMGSGSFKGTYPADHRAADAISQIYFEPPYFPSLDGAKTFLGDYWQNHPSGKVDKQLHTTGGGSNNSSMCSSSSKSNDSGDQCQEAWGSNSWESC